VCNLRLSGGGRMLSTIGEGLGDLGLVEMGDEPNGVEIGRIWRLSG
jgi:hypothetical protein